MRSEALAPWGEIVEREGPSQYRPEMGAKAQIYLGASTRLVWVVSPKRREVDVWLPGDERPSRTLGADNALDGMDVLPGFMYPLSDLLR